ncbi:quinol:cytochrome C oxidoreductase [Pedobacter hiemivivus]|uniref:Quinol:cytochrome C oxidoreductase n=1 Tax=Pedobacter hiemivivus TaxID=2530454 RepID=A0A4V6WPM5_9SPHI|nr:quinol:cytochrome C oxidoreductase [Pedobacter hiemivivus]TKC62386.1 quinol:cytochrome C oxidoreductase [Pedobacter hiemivivus]
MTNHSFDEQFIFKRKTRAWTFVLITIGITGTLYGFLSGSAERTFSNLLLMGYYFAAICIFGVCFCAIQYVSQAGWSASILRIPQVFARLLPAASAILLIIIAAGIFTTHTGLNEEGKEVILPYLYKLWAAQGITSPASENYDALIAGKSAYLNIPFFFIRLVSYLSAYSFLGWLLVKYSRNEDEIGGILNHKKSFKISCIFLVVVGFTVPLFTFDTIMSLEAHWFSTMFGWYNFSAFLVTGLAVLTLTIIYLKEAGYLQWVNENHLHSLGLQVFGFSIFWTYLWFEQFLLQYYANIPEEVVYFYKRQEPEFNIWFWANIVLNFCVPLLVLMSRDAKRQMKLMKFVCVTVVLGHWVDYWLMIMPGTTGPQSHWYTEIGFIEVSIFIGFAGLFVNLVLSSLSKFKALAPKNHPFLEESVHHHIN